MYGDHPGSPRRDSRQNAAEFEPAENADYGDVRVAGSPLEPAMSSMAIPGAAMPEPLTAEPSMAGPVPADQALRQETMSDNGPGSRSARHKIGPLQRIGLVKVAAISAVAVVAVGGGGVALAMSGGAEDGGTVRPQAVADAADAAVTAEKRPVDPQQLEADRRKAALARAQRAARSDKRRTLPLAVKGTPLPSPTASASDSGSGSAGTASAGNPVPAGEAQRIAKKMLPSFGFDPATQFGCLVKLWDRESGWRTTAANPSGAYGIPQALPGSKMAAYGDDWRTNPSTQIKWGLNYIKGRYNTPCGAWAAFQSKGWY